MDHLRFANIALDVFCILLTLLPIGYLLTNQRYRQRQNQCFLGACIANILMITGDLPDWIFPTISSGWEQKVLEVASMLFYLASAFVLYFFISYMVEYLQLAGPVRKGCRLYALTLSSLQGGLALLSLVTGSVFYVNANGYQRGPLFWTSQVIPIFCCLLPVALIFRYRRQLKGREVLFFLLYIFIPLGSLMTQMLLRGIAVVNAGVTVATLVVLMNVQVEHEVTIKEQEKELVERRIDIMLSQIQPHFLYNSLGVIYHLCESDPAAARKAVKRFSDFLRGNMESLKSRDPISFASELDHVDSYLYLEQQRFGDKLQVIYQIKTEDFLIPPLTLQPLVENAVQHGILNRRDGGTVVIRTEEADGMAVVTVSDNGVGIDKARQQQGPGDHSHLGIVNVRSRLEEMVGGSLEIESSGEGTVATIRIPCTEEVDYDAYFNHR